MLVKINMNKSSKTKREKTKVSKEESLECDKKEDVTSEETHNVHEIKSSEIPTEPEKNESSLHREKEEGNMINILFPVFYGT